MTTLELHGQQTYHDRLSTFNGTARRLGLAMLHFFTERHPIPRNAPIEAQLLVASAVEVTPVGPAQTEQEMTADGYGGHLLDRRVGFGD